MAPSHTKRCEGCGEVKPLSDFYYDFSDIQATLDTRQVRCKKCADAQFKSRTSRRRKKLRTVKIDGQEYPIAEAAKVIGITREALYQRIDRLDWHESDAVKKKPRRKGNLILTGIGPDGPIDKYAREWANEMPGDPDVNLARICMRHKRGWTDAQALGIDPPPSRSRKAAPAKSTKSPCKPVKGQPDGKK
jgi:hypothetical protein